MNCCDNREDQTLALNYGWCAFCEIIFFSSKRIVLGKTVFFSFLLSSPLFLFKVDIPLCVYTRFCLFFIGHLGFFYLLAVLNNAAVKYCIWVTAFSSFGHITRSMLEYLVILFSVFFLHSTGDWNPGNTELYPQVSLFFLGKVLLSFQDGLSLVILLPQPPE